MAKKAPAKKAPATRQPRAKKPVEPSLAEYYLEMQRLQARIDAGEVPAPSKPPRPNGAPDVIELPEPPKPIAWRSWLVSGAKAAALIVCGAVAGVWVSGGIEVGPGPVVYTDSLAQSHTNDRASQIRILREYAGKTFSGDPDAQKWLNEQRIAARPTDWIPYSDELGFAADAGVDAVKAFADKLEGKR